MKSIFRSRVFRRYLAIASSVCLIALLSVAIGSLRTERLLTHNKEQESAAALQEITNIVNSSVFHAVAQSENLVSEQEFLNIISLSKEEVLPRNHITYLAARDRLLRYQLRSNLIRECAVVFPNTHMLMFTQNHIVTNIKIHYESGLFRYQGVSYDDFLSDFVQREDGHQSSFALMPSRDVFLPDGQSSNVITATKTINFPGKQDHVSVLLLIDTSAITRQVSTFMPGYEGWLALTDQSGNLLLIENESSLSESEIVQAMSGEIEDLAGTVLRAESMQPTGFIYHMYIPDSWFQQQVSPLLSPMQLVLLLALGAIALIAAGAVLISGMPLGRLERRFSESFCIEQPFQGVEDSVNQLFDSNSELRGTIRDMLPKLAAGVLERLYKGGILEADELNLVDFLKDTFPRRYRVAILRWRNYPGSQDAPTPIHLKGLAQRELSERFERMWIHRCDINTVAFLIDTQIYTQERMMEALQEVLDYFTDELPCLFAIAVGGQYELTSAIHSSYAEACVAMARISDRSVERLALYDESGHHVTEYLFPYEHKERLTVYIANGDAVYLKGLMEQLYERNFVSRHFTADDQSAYFSDLASILLRLKDKGIETGGDPPRAGCIRAPYTIFELFLKRYTSIAMTQRQNSNTMDFKLQEEMLSYIGQNFTDPALSLKLLAKKFSLTEKYVSHFFKAQNGQGFSEYVENLRLTEAVRLMEDPSLSLSRVYIMVGYVTGSTFYKAFRRRYGMSPSTWRETRRSQRLDSN